MFYIADAGLDTEMIAKFVIGFSTAARAEVWAREFWKAVEMRRNQVKRPGGFGGMQSLWKY